MISHEIERSLLHVTNTQQQKCAIWLENVCDQDDVWICLKVSLLQRLHDAGEGLREVGKRWSIATSLWKASSQARNQLGTAGGAKSFLGGAHIF